MRTKVNATTLSIIRTSRVAEWKSAKKVAMSFIPTVTGKQRE